MIDLRKIYTESNIKTLSRVPNDFIDLTVTSPPYDDMTEDFVVVQKNGLRDYQGYSWDFKKLAEELYRTTKPGGGVVWVVNDPIVDGSESLASCYQKIYFKKVGFNIHDTMIYEKNSSAIPDPTRYLQVFEYMIFLTKGRPKTVNFIEDRRNRFRERWGKGRKVREKDGSFTERQNYISKEEGRRYNIWKYNTGGGTQLKMKLLLNTLLFFLKPWQGITFFLGRMKGILFTILLQAPEPFQRFVKYSKGNGSVQKSVNSIAT